LPRRLKQNTLKAKILYDEDSDHYYAEIDGKYYDAENPTGVSSRQDMIWCG